MEITLREWLAEKPFTLTMSSGFFSFFAHCGMLSILEEEQLLPAKITGSSAGAMVGALWAAGCSTQQLKEILFQLTRKDFWDPDLGLGLLQGNLFREKIKEISPVSHLEHCEVPVALSVFDGISISTRVMRRGPIWEAIYASCAVPFLFQPIRIQKRLYWDGGITDRPGLAGTLLGERVFYHHIVSRSPWRKKNSKVLEIPKRRNLATLAIHNLTRVGPNKLPQGKAAFWEARLATQKALDTTLDDFCVELQAEKK